MMANISSRFDAVLTSRTISRKSGRMVKDLRRGEQMPPAADARHALCDEWRPGATLTEEKFEFVGKRCTEKYILSPQRLQLWVHADSAGNDRAPQRQMGAVGPYAASDLHG
jgi:hypothetical protein